MANCGKECVNRVEWIWRLVQLLKLFWIEGYLSSFDLINDGSASFLSLFRLLNEILKK